ncbi:hypothetical protein ACFE04_028488 [Oxalis oulophora]
MTEVLLHNSPHFPSSPTTTQNPSEEEAEEAEEIEEVVVKRSSSGGQEQEQEQDQGHLSLLALLVAILRKSVVVCKTTTDNSHRRDLCAAMEIGLPSNVRHVTHVTFDRFNGFLGLPVEFQPHLPTRPPSASATVFGVSTESMQLSYDTRGNSVPTILLLMQRHLYIQGGLQAEGLFRINAENSQEEYVREQLNRGVIPEGIDVHCLAGLIKVDIVPAWFRELPTGVLDSLEPEDVIQSQTEEDCVHLVRQLPPTESSLLDWAINLMTDVVQHEHLNKMNARNIAMVFAPNMTQMADPLTALMYAVQVMNFLKVLILKTLREREDSIVEQLPNSHLGPHDENEPHSPSKPNVEDDTESDNEEITKHAFVTEEPVMESQLTDSSGQSICLANRYYHGHSIASIEKHMGVRDQSCETDAGAHQVADSFEANPRKSKMGQSSNPSFNKWSKKPALIELPGPISEKAKGIINESIRLAQDYDAIAIDNRIIQYDSREAADIKMEEEEEVYLSTICGSFITKHINITLQQQQQQQQEGVFSFPHWDPLLYNHHTQHDTRKMGN